MRTLTFNVSSYVDAAIELLLCSIDGFTLLLQTVLLLHLCGRVIFHFEILQSIFKHFHIYMGLQVQQMSKLQLK